MPEKPKRDNSQRTDAFRMGLRRSVTLANSRRKAQISEAAKGRALYLAAIGLTTEEPDAKKTKPAQ